MATRYRFLGKAFPRKDASEVVTGRARFVGDIKMAGMLYGRILHSPHPHANVKRIKTNRAESLKGVVTVLTHENAPNWRLGTPQHLPVLDSKVRFVGDAVALVAAESEGIAETALRSIDVEYEVLPAVYDVEEAMKPGAPQLWEMFPGNLVTPGMPRFGEHALQELVMGDIEKGFQEADVIAEGTCVYEGIPNPMPPEPPAIIAVWDGPDNLYVCLATQGPPGGRAMIYNALGGNVNVRTDSGACGGSYGSKWMSLLVYLQAAALARAAHRPVKLCYSKKEHMATFTVRLGSRINGKVGMKKDGTVTAIAGEWLINTGYYSMSTQGMVAVGCGELQLALRCPNWDLKPKIICTNRTASGIVRGYGGQELKCAFLPLLTLAMEKIGIDPFEFFKKNYVKAGDGYYWRDGNWWVCRGVDYTKAMEAGAEAFGWREKWRGWLRATATNGNKRRGVGVGIHGNADIGESTTEGYVRLDSNGTAMVYSPLGEPGTGQRTSLCKMVAEVLQLPVERVGMTPSDPSISPFDKGPAGSRGTYAEGSAYIAAAEDALKKLLELSARHFDAKPEDLATEDGAVYVQGRTQDRVPWRQIMGDDRTILGYGRFEQDFTLANMMMSFVEVEVDTDTGHVELINVVNATDVGQIIDSANLENQLNGCLGAAGLDSALTEESVLDQKSGRILNGNMIDYKWRSFAELPLMKNVVLETPFPSHRFGAIGVGEISTAPGASAVLMAVSNCIGVRLDSYPITPDKVLGALAKVEEGKGKQ